MSDETEPDEQIAWVTLYCEQVAQVAVRAPRNASRTQLQHLALRGLDDSGGAEWVTRAGWIEHVAWEESQRLSDAELSGDDGLNIDARALDRALTTDHQIQTSR
jgi:hypothetical protein